MVKLDGMKKVENLYVKASLNLDESYCDNRESFLRILEIAKIKNLRKIPPSDLLRYANSLVLWSEKFGDLRFLNIVLKMIDKGLVPDDILRTESSRKWVKKM